MSDARCEPPVHLREVDGWHWVATPDGQYRFCHRWWKARGRWGWATLDARSAHASRYLAPVTPPAEVDALRAEASEWCQKVQLCEGRIHKLRAELAAAREALEKIASWCEAYPAKVFPQENADASLAACKKAGIPIDAMHGTWARHLLSGIGRDARAALGDPT